MPIIKLPVVIVGDHGTGKTALCHRFLYGEFKENTSPTDSPKLYIKGIPLGSFVIEVNLIELPADEEQRDGRLPYYPTASAIFYCYDLTDPETLDSVLGWSAEAEEGGFKGIQFLVGLKDDLDSKVEPEEAENISTEIGAYHVKVSSKTGEGIPRLFARLLAEIVKGIKSSNRQPPER